MIEGCGRERWPLEKITFSITKGISRKKLPDRNPAIMDKIECRRSFLFKSPSNIDLLRMMKENTRFGVLKVIRTLRMS